MPDRPRVRLGGAHLAEFADVGATTIAQGRQEFAEATFPHEKAPDLCPAALFYPLSRRSGGRGHLMRVLLDLDQRVVAGVGGDMEIRGRVLARKGDVGGVDAVVDR